MKAAPKSTEKGMQGGDGERCARCCWAICKQARRTQRLASPTKLLISHDDSIGTTVIGEGDGTDKGWSLDGTTTSMVLPNAVQSRKPCKVFEMDTDMSWFFSTVALDVVGTSTSKVRADSMGTGMA